VFPNSAFCVDVVDEQVAGITKIEGCEEVFHREPDRIEHLFALCSADGDDHCPAILRQRIGKGFFENIFSYPQRLASVDEDFCLRTDGHKENGSRKDEQLGVKDFFDERLVVVLDAADTGFVAVAALGAGADIEPGEADVFGCCTG